jgi:hypothetical protein
MKKTGLVFALLGLYAPSLMALVFHNSSQTDTLPYYEIPDYPASYTPQAVAARMVDGLGFRYYWATEGLRPEDLSYRPSPEARTSEETIDHIMGLTNMIANALDSKVNNFSGEETSKLSFDVKRKKTLESLKTISDRLKTSSDPIENYKIKMKRGDQIMELPFWNLMNGPIADALWHVGQVVSFRRASGNPFNSKASVLTGKVRK